MWGCTCHLGGDEKCTQNVGGKNFKGKGHLEDLGVDGTVLKWILKK